MKWLTLTITFLYVSFLGLSNCLAQTQAELSHETAQFVSPGMPFARAISNLEAIGYRCGKSELANDDPKAAFCSRQQSHRVLATCVHTVLLWPAGDGEHLDRLEVLAPACAGL